MVTESVSVSVVAVFTLKCDELSGRRSERRGGGWICSAPVSGHAGTAWTGGAHAS